MTATTFLLMLAALNLGHVVGDFLVQTSRQAELKFKPGWDGRAACAAHCATYTATQAAVIACLLLTVPVSGAQVAAGLAFSGVTHYLIDRRTLLARFAAATGKADYFATDAGRLAMDQAAHQVMLWIAATMAAA